MAAPKDSKSKAKPEAKSQEIDSTKATSFQESYRKLLSISEGTAVPSQQDILTSFVKKHADTFTFKQYEKFVTKDNNDKLFTALNKSLQKNHSNYDLQTAIFQTIRVLSRSKTGTDVLMEESFHERMLHALKTSRRKLIVQTLAVMANLCFMNKDKVTKHAVKHHTYRQIVNILTNKDKKFKKNEDKIFFLGLNSLFYLCLDKEIGKDIYKDNTFFEWLFNLFLDKSKHFEDKQFWIRNKLKPKPEENDEQKQEYNTDEDCRLIVEVLRILFNFTLVETNVLKFKLDTFPAPYQKKVVGRAVSLLSVPCSYEPEFNTDCNAKLLHLCETPGLISIKLKICNVALYDGDILGMNLQMDSVQPICDLMEFYCMQTRHTYETQPQIAAMMMFLKAVCRYNGKVREGIKKYIFKEDADPNNNSDSESDEDEQATKDKMMAPKHLDVVKDGEETIKNLLIKHCTSVNYSVKRTVAEFLFALCGDDQKEMIRLCGLGNAIGIFVDKGIPGFVGAANNAMNLDTMAKVRREKEKKMKEKQQKEAQKKNEKKPGNDASGKPQSG
eukprot:194608_1